MSTCRPRRRVLLACAAALAAGGCATLDAPQTQALLARAAGLPASAERREVPFFPQTPHHCGPAALATVLTHAGFGADVDTLAAQVFLPARQGTLQTEMLAGARRAGALAVRLPGTLDALLQEAVDGHPPVVLLNLGLSWLPRWHYAVVVGHDLPAGELVLRSGATQRARFPLQTFERTWARAGHWAFVVVPPGELPRTASEADVHQAALGFERSAAPAEAARAWQSVVDRWPGSLVARMGQGNALHAAGRLHEAARAFEQAAQQHDSAAAWNNLALTLHALGDTAAAHAAAQRAVARAHAAEPSMLQTVLQTQGQMR
ncbi:MAG: PA2778 family cysteine peptidase [Pseudomonadota bacterium]